MPETVAPPKTPAAGHTAAGFVEEQLARGSRPNRLLQEKSPYLLQHAFNPVDWHPWGEEAFARARAEDKPIFLSIGYSTCHWCHVMAHESFEDPGTAALLNRYFVAVKVDREERPDVDQLYMAATRAMTGGGGWPMSVFLLPDRRPFYAGTYFPPEPGHGLPAFPELLEAIGRAWTGDRRQIGEVAAQITGRLELEMIRVQGEPGKLSADVIDRASRQLAAEYDERHGGFGREPKFPRPVSLNLLWRAHLRGSEAAREMALATLRKMAEGGLRDQLGGGFHRYSVDRQWRVPHFEKMLYDQAQLATAYLDGFQVTAEPFFAEVARTTLDYVLRDLTAPQGGFFSAEDADSPLPEDPERRGEGAFYLWQAGEIRERLGSQTGAAFCYRYGVEEEGNALVDPRHEFKGRNVLYLARSLPETAERFGRPAEEIRAELAGAARALLAARAHRPRPHLDDKVITAWNGLMIGALAKGYQVLAEERYLAAARQAADFVLAMLRDEKSGRLRRRYRDGEAGLEAHLDDYVFLVQGLLDLYEAAGEIRWLQAAAALTAHQIELFADERGGGFFDSSGWDPAVLVRMKSDYDGAEPAGNSVAALNLQRLGAMTGNREWQERGRRTIAAFGAVLDRQPLAMPQMAVALDFLLAAPRQIVMAGEPGREDTRALLRVVHQRFLPNKVLLFADGGAGQEWLAERLPSLRGMTVLDGRAAAHVCENYTCRMPTAEVDRLRELLG